MRYFTLLLIAVWLLFIAAFGYGWVENIITLAHSTGPITGMFVLRCVGIPLAALGAVLGYL